MKNYKKIFYIVLGGVLFTTISVLAYTLSSSQVLYKNINNQDVTVEEALDDLYSKMSVYKDQICPGCVYRKSSVSKYNVYS